MLIQITHSFVETMLQLTRRFQKKPFVKLNIYVPMWFKKYHILN